MTSFEIQAASNYGHDVREFNRNNEPEAVIRESFSNAKDALAKNIYFGPLATCFNHKKHTGFYFFDDGVGMHPNSLGRDSVQGENPVILHDEDGNQCGSWYAFITNGFSSKRRQHLIGHKGQGSKLLFSCKDSLTIISKAKLESAKWLLCRIEKPEEHMLGLRSELQYDQTNSLDNPKVIVTEMEGEEVQNYLESHICNIIKKDLPRALHVQEHFKRVINGGRGTLIFALGVSDPDLRDYLLQLDQEFSLKQENTKEGVHANHMIKLHSFISFKTIMGHPLAEKSLQEAGFENRLVNQYKTQDNLPTLHINTKEVQDYSMLPGLKTVPHKHSAGDNACPLRIREMKKARFQDRHIGKMTVGGTNNYTVLLLLDGTAHRLETYLMLGRRGGKKTIQKRSGIPMGDFTGVTIYCKGMYICRLDSLLDHEMYGDFRKLYTENVQYTGHYQLIIDCENIEVISSRNGISTIAKQELLCDEFREKLRNMLRRFCAGNSVFDRFIKRLNKLNTDALEKGAMQDMENRLKYIQLMQRMEIVIDERHHYILEPMEGDENLVIAIYFELRALLSAKIGEMKNDDAKKYLQCLWPDCKHVTGAAGLDAIGLMANIETSLRNQIPESACAHVEFKTMLKILDECKRYNHSLTATDFIICWDFLHDPETILEAIENKSTVVDHIDNRGITTDHIRVYAGKHEPPLEWQVPESMKGFCFCITDIEKDGELKRYDHKAVHGVIVFSLKKLIEATVGSEHIKTIERRDALNSHKSKKHKRDANFENGTFERLLNSEAREVFDELSEEEINKVKRSITKKRWNIISKEPFKVLVQRNGSNSFQFYLIQGDIDGQSGSQPQSILKMTFSSTSQLKKWIQDQGH